MFCSGKLGGEAAGATPPMMRAKPSTWRRWNLNLVDTELAKARITASKIQKHFIIGHVGFALEALARGLRNICQQVKSGNTRIIPLYSIKLQNTSRCPT